MTRFLNIEYLFLQDFVNCYISESVFDIKWYSQFNSILNIVRTLFITFALGFAMIIFNKDAQRLVLRPIERMLRKVKEVSENPLAGLQASRIKVSATTEIPKTLGVVCGWGSPRGERGGGDRAVLFLSHF